MFLSVCIIFLPAYALIWRAGCWIDKKCDGQKYRYTNKLSAGEHNDRGADIGTHPVDVFLCNKTVVRTIDRIVGHFLGSDNPSPITPREYLR